MVTCIQYIHPVRTVSWLSLKDDKQYLIFFDWIVVCYHFAFCMTEPFITGQVNLISYFSLYIYIFRLSYTFFSGIYLLINTIYLDSILFYMLANNLWIRRRQILTYALNKFGSFSALIEIILNKTSFWSIFSLVTFQI